MPDVFGTETSPDNLTDEERMRRFFAGTAPSRPLPAPPPSPTIDQPGDVTPGIGKARAEVAATPPDLGSPIPAAPSAPPKLGLTAPQPITPAEQMREQGPPKLGGWKKGLDIASQILASSPAVSSIAGAIPGSTINYNRRLGQAEKEESRQMGMRKEEAGMEETSARTDLARAEAEKARRPEPVKPDKLENLQQELADLTQENIAAGKDPNKDPRIQQVSDVITGLQKQPAPPKDNKAVAGTLNGAPAWGLQTETGWIDPDTKKPLPGFKPPLNYAQGVAPTKTVELLGPDNVMHRFQYNEATGAYDKDMGAAPTGTAAHQIFQSGAIEQMAPKIIADINANRQVLGHLSSYYKQWLSGTPVSDPAASQMMAELMSFAATQPALHAFRSTNALEAFEKIIGGLAKDPDSTIATIKGMMMLPETFTGMPQRAGQKPGQGNAPPATQGQPPGPPSPGMKWQQNKRTGEYRQVPIG